MTGGYLEWQIRQRLIGPIIAFRDYIFREVTPHFVRLNERADEIGNEYYDKMISQPADEYFGGDLSGFAEDAHDAALSWWEMMRSLRQTMLNLLAAGLFHLTEQQLYALSTDAGLRYSPLNDTKLDTVAEWYHATFQLELELLPAWALVDELRLVANTVKHGEGSSSRKLRDRRPELFCDPALATAFAKTGIKDWMENRRISAPLAGEDVFVTEELLRSYAAAAESLLTQIADYFAAHADESFYRP